MKAPRRADISSTLAGVSQVCPGLLEALVVDARGLVLERWSRPEAGGAEGTAGVGGGREGPGGDAAAVAMVSAIPALGRVAATTRIGRPAEWLLVGEKGTVLLRRIGRLELFLLLRLTPEEWVGRARFAARTLSARLEPVLAAR